MSKAVSYNNHCFIWFGLLLEILTT